MMQRDDGSYWDPRYPSEEDLIKHREKWGESLYYVLHETTDMRDKRQRDEAGARLIEAREACEKQMRAFGLRLLQWLRDEEELRNKDGEIIGLAAQHDDGDRGFVDFWFPRNYWLTKLVEQFYLLDVDEKGAGDGQTE